MSDQPDGRLELTPTQQALYQAIADKRSDIAVYYHAAVVVLNDAVLPDRLALAAHSLRELMEKLPSDEMAVDMGADLSSKVNALRPPWEEAVAEESVRGGETWGNGIGEKLRSFLDAVAEFFRRQDGIAVGRREQTVQYLNRVDPAAVPLPPDLQGENARAWMHLRGYFNAVSHHRFPTEEQAFQERVNQLEAFLSSRLVPRPTDDFAAIDALLEEE